MFFKNVKDTKTASDLENFHTVPSPCSIIHCAAFKLSTLGRREATQSIHYPIACQSCKGITPALYGAPQRMYHRAILSQDRKSLESWQPNSWNFFIYCNLYHYCEIYDLFWLAQVIILEPSLIILLFSVNYFSCGNVWPQSPTRLNWNLTEEPSDR